MLNIIMRNAAIASGPQLRSHRRTTLAFIASFVLLFSAHTQAQVTTYCCDQAAETAYLNDLAAQYPAAGVVAESFESGPWVPARVNVQSSVTNQGIRWFRSGNGLRTGTGGGVVHDGSYLMYASQLGNTSHPVPDGFSLQSSGSSMHGVGGWFLGTGAKISFTLDGDPNRVNFSGTEATISNSWKFLGFIDSTAFSRVDILAVDEVGNETNIFTADDFRIAVQAGAGSLEFDPAAYSVAENGGSVTLTVTRTGGSAGAITVDYDTGDGTATAGTDYSATNGTLTFADGVLSRTFTVPILDDSTYEGDEDFAVTLSNATGGASLGVATTSTVTITENDPTPPAGSLQFSSSTYSVPENGGALQVTVTRTGGSFGDVSVNYSTADGSATASSDYNANSGTLNFADGVTSRTFNVVIINDSTYEDDETFGLALSGVSGGASLGAPANATATILEDDPVPPAGNLQFSSATYSGAENSGSAVITVTRSGGSFGTVTVDFATSNGTASAGSDYQANSGTLTFNNGVTSRTFSVTLLDDTVYEGDESVNLALSNPGGGASLGARTSATLSITENDPPPSSGTLKFSGATYTIAENGTSVLATVTRTGGSFGAVSVDYTTADGSATAGSDYATTSGTLNFAAGVTNQSFPVTIINDTIYEGNEAFTLNLSNVTGGATLGTPATATVTITEDDAVPPAGNLQFSGATYSVAENGTSLLVTVTRSGGSFGTVGVSYSTSDGTAIAGSDYSAASGTLSFGDGVLSRTFSVTVLNDTTYEGNETFAIGLSNVTGGATLGTPASTTVTINEDDPRPPAGSLQFSSNNYTVAENGVSRQVTVTRTGGSFGAVSVAYSTSNGSAVAGSDYASKTGTLNFADGVTSQSFSVGILNDTTYEGDETFAVSLANVQGGATIGAPATATITITEDDPTPPAGSLQFSSAAYLVAENGNTRQVTVTRTGGSFGAVSVDYATADGAATAGSDYAARSGTLNFADGVLSQSFSVTILNDTTYEGDESFSVNLTNPTGGATIGAPASAGITITEDDPQPPAGSLQFGNGTYTVAENGASLQVTVTRTGGSFGAVSVNYSTNDGSATASSDFAFASGTLNFADGVTSKSFSITILNDTNYEGDEVFSVSLSNPTGGATLGTPASASVTITEDDPEPPAGSLKFTSAAYTVAENGGSVQINVTRTGGSFGAVSVNYATADGSATAGSDYGFASGTLDFADGVTSRSFIVTILNDTDYEGDEAFSVSLSNAVGGASIGTPASATITIAEDDPAPPAGSLQLSGSAFTVAENGGSLQVTVTRVGGSFGAVTVNYATINGSALAGSDFAAVNGTLNFADGVTTRTFSVSILNDAIYEGNETFGVGLSNATGGASIGTPASATVTISEDDAPPPAGSLQLSGSTYTVAENTASILVTVTRTGGSFGSVGVAYATSNGSAVAGSDYTATSGTLTFADSVTSQTFSVPILDDSTYEGAENFSVSLASPTGGASLGTPASASVTISDNEPLPSSGSLQFSGASYTVAEGATALQVTVTRSGGSFGAISVNYAATSGTATAGSDFATTSGTLNFADGIMSQSFSVPMIEDSIYEGDETFSIGLTNATGGASIGTPSSATVTITDNDALPPAGSLQFSASGYVVDENGGSVVVTVNRTGGSFGVVNVNYSTSDGSAKAGSDFASTSGKLIFADGVLSQTFSVSILDDTNYEGDEIFAVGLSNATGGATIGSPFAAAVTIADNDPAPQFGSLQFQAGTYTVAEDGVSLSVTVTRTGGNSGEVKVNYSTADASASAGNDYTATIGTLTFPDGVTSQSFSVSIFDDAVYEGDEQFSLQLTNATGGASLGVPANATVTITENDAPPSFGSLQFGSGTYSVSESGVTATVTVIRTGGSDGIVSVDYATSDLSASAGSDYVSASDSLIFADGELSQSFTVTILDDLDYEGDEIFAVSLSAVTGGAAIGVPASTVITISEDDSPPSAGSLQFTGSRYSVAEDGAAIEITVSRVGGDFGAVTVGYSTSDISAKSGSDYVLVSDTLSFADGQTSQSFFVPIIDDAEYEGDETFSVSLVNATGGAIISSPSNATVTITENDPVPPAGSLQFSGSSYSAMETDGILQVTVTRTGGSFGSVTVDYATSNISATAGSDYTAANGTLTFADGVISQVVNLAITDDAIYEGDETLSIALSKATGGAFIGMPNSATVRIIENDVPPPGGSLQFSGSNYPVQENAGTVSITVTRTGGSFGEVSVNYATSNGSAIAGSDYTAGSGTLVFADSVMSRTFDISVVDDTVYEGTETFTVSLSGVSADASIGSPSSATLTIGDNDPRPPVTPPASGGGGGGAIGPFGLVLALCGLAIGRRRKMIKGSSRRAVGRPFAMIAGLLIAVPLVGAATEQGEAPDPHAGHKMMMQQNTLQRSTHEYVYEGIPVTNMQGEASTLGEQVGDDRIVVVNFIFTTCTTICPVQSATLAQVQRQLGEKAGDVTMISVSIDPEHDTPARLREYSQLFKAGPQWQFLTGSADDMIRIQKAFDAYHGAKMNHRPLTFIKTPGETRWLRLEGMASAADIVGELQSIMSH